MYDTGRGQNNLRLQTWSIIMFLDLYVVPWYYILHLRAWDVTSINIVQKYCCLIYTEVFKWQIKIDILSVREHAAMLVHILPNCHKCNVFFGSTLANIYISSAMLVTSTFAIPEIFLLALKIDVRHKICMIVPTVFSNFDW